jgi:hypothetical protein
MQVTEIRAEHAGTKEQSMQEGRSEQESNQASSLVKAVREV